MLAQEKDDSSEIQTIFNVSSGATFKGYGGPSINNTKIGINPGVFVGGNGIAMIQVRTGFLIVTSYSLLNLT